MDARLTLPILLLVVAISLGGAVETALRPSTAGFSLGPAGVGSSGLAAVAMSGAVGQAPALTWTGVPDGTACFVLIGEDLDAEASAEPFWTIARIPGATREVASGQGNYQAPPLRTLTHHRLQVALYALGDGFDPAELTRAELDRFALGRAVWRVGGGWTD